MRSFVFVAIFHSLLTIYWEKRKRNGRRRTCVFASTTACAVGKLSLCIFCMKVDSRRAGCKAACASLPVVLQACRLLYARTQWLCKTSNERQKTGDGAHFDAPRFAHDNLHDKGYREHEQTPVHVIELNETPNRHDGAEGQTDGAHEAKERQADHERCDKNACQRPQA